MVYFVMRGLGKGVGLRSVFFCGGVVSIMGGDMRSPRRGKWSRLKAWKRRTREYVSLRAVKVIGFAQLDRLLEAVQPASSRKSPEEKWLRKHILWRFTCPTDSDELLEYPLFQRSGATLRSLRCVFLLMVWAAV